MRNSPFTQEPIYQAQWQPMSQFSTPDHRQRLNLPYQEKAQPLLFLASNLQAQLHSPLDISNPQAQLFSPNPQQAQLHSPLNISNPQQQLFSPLSYPDLQAQLFGSISNLQQTQLHSPSTISNPQEQLFSSLWDPSPQAQL